MKSVQKEPYAIQIRVSIASIAVQQTAHSRKPFSIRAEKSNMYETHDLAEIKQMATWPIHPT